MFAFHHAAWRVPSGRQDQQVEQQHHHQHEGDINTIMHDPQATNRRRIEQNDETIVPWEDERTRTQPPPRQPAIGSSRELTARFARMLSLKETRVDQLVALRSLKRRSGRESKNCAQEKKLARRQLLRLRQQHDDHMRETIAHLQHTIDQIERSKTLSDSHVLLWRTNRSGVVADICREYFVQFGAGYDPSQLHNAQQQAVVRAFMGSVAEEDLVCREYRGRDKLLEQWTIYTKFHSTIVTRLQRITLIDEEDDVVSICCVAELELGISDTTLRNLYPAFHALAQRDAKSKTIADGLIGKRYIVSVDKVMHFNRHGKIFAHESRVHLATGLLEALKDPFAAMQVLEGSAMTTDGHWKLPDVDYVRSQHDEMYDMPKSIL